MRSVHAVIRSGWNSGDRLPVFVITEVSRLAVFVITEVSRLAVFVITEVSRLTVFQLTSTASPLTSGIRTAAGWKQQTHQQRRSHHTG